MAMTVEVRPEHRLEASLMPNDDLVTAIQVSARRFAAMDLGGERPLTDELMSWDIALEEEALRRMAG